MIFQVFKRVRAEDLEVGSFCYRIVKEVVLYKEHKTYLV